MLSRDVSIPIVTVAVIAAVSAVVEIPGAPIGLNNPSRYSDAIPSDPLEGINLEDVPGEVEEFMRNGQSWRAARLMRRYLDETASPEPAAILLAARAEAGWGGWGHVRQYLEGREWLDDVNGGEGWYWLARALEKDEEREAAIAAYQNYRSAGSGGEDNVDQRLVAELREGLLLLEIGRTSEGTALLASIRENAPAISPWVDLLAGEALATRGDIARVEALVDPDAPGELGVRSRSALFRAHREAGDLAGARELATRFRTSAESDSERAYFAAEAGRLAAAEGDADSARELLLAAVAAAPSSAAAGTAATLLEELGNLSAEDRLAIAGVYDRRGQNETAVERYRAWLEGGSGTPAQRREVRLNMGRALFDTGNYSAAARELAPLTDGSGSQAAEALYLVGRAEHRQGNSDEAQQIFARLAERFPGSATGSEGLFLVADLSHDDGEIARAAGGYRQVASNFRGTDRAGLSLMRLGGIAFAQQDFQEAAEVWEEYRDTYPQGQRWLQSTYWAGRAYQEMGDLPTAREYFRAVKERDPLSYYALRASQRLGEPFWPVPMSSSPDPDPAAEARVEEWMRTVDLLRDAGLHAEAEAQADRLIARARGDEPVMYELAEALNERGYTLRGIRLGWDLEGSGPPSERLLRITYPFPYRAMISAEAEEKALDPFLVAALTRQESLFKARISSPVGARGLMQIMPETGRVLASSVGIEEWDPEILYNPEINAHLGTIYLAEQMETYDGSLPSVFSAYNAGPHRVEDWSAFPEYGNEELFTERIPYRETREYVKILTRNKEIYEGLYGSDG